MAMTNAAGAETHVSKAVSGTLQKSGFQLQLKPYSCDPDGYPSNWGKSFLLASEESGKNYHLVDCQDNLEYRMIKQEFDNVNICIDKIQRIENKKMWETYKQEMDLLKKHRHQGYQLNERYLFHGTTVSRDSICEEGLDMRLSTTGLFGKGTYFSDDPRKCVKYSSERSGDVSLPYMLKCRVILGDIKEYTAGVYDHELKREPVKENPAPGEHKKYDSVKGRPKDFNEYVIYDNRRALIEYIITFHKPEQGESNDINGQASGFVFTPPGRPGGGASDVSASLGALSYSRLDTSSSLGAMHHSSEPRRRSLDEVMEEDNEELEEIRARESNGINPELSEVQNSYASSHGNVTEAVHPEIEELTRSGTIPSAAGVPHNPPDDEEMPSVRPVFKTARSRPSPSAQPQPDPPPKSADADLDEEVRHQLLIQQVRAEIRAKRKEERVEKALAEASKRGGIDYDPKMDMLSKLTTWEQAFEDGTLPSHLHQSFKDTYGTKLEELKSMPAGGATNNPEDDEEEAINEVLNRVVKEFLEITATEDVSVATDFATRGNYDISEALNLYYQSLS